MYGMQSQVKLRAIMNTCIALNAQLESLDGIKVEAIHMRRISFMQLNQRNAKCVLNENHLLNYFIA